MIERLIEFWLQGALKRKVKVPRVVLLDVMLKMATPFLTVLLMVRLLTDAPSAPSAVAVTVFASPSLLSLTPTRAGVSLFPVFLLTVRGFGSDKVAIVQAVEPPP